MPIRLRPPAEPTPSPPLPGFAPRGHRITAFARSYQFRPSVSGCAVDRLEFASSAACILAFRFRRNVTASARPARFRSVSCSSILKISACWSLVPGTPRHALPIQEVILPASFPIPSTKCRATESLLAPKRLDLGPRLFNAGIKLLPPVVLPRGIEHGRGGLGWRYSRL